MNNHGEVSSTIFGIVVLIGFLVGLSFIDWDDLAKNDDKPDVNIEIEININKEKEKEEPEPEKLKYTNLKMGGK